MVGSNIWSNFKMIINGMDGYMESAMIYTVFVSVLCILLLILHYLKNRNMKELQEQYDIQEKLIQMIHQSKTIENSLVDLLSIIGTIVQAPTYAIYLLDEKNNHYTLKSVRQMVQDQPNIEPSYSGLLPYKKEIFYMPGILPEDSMPKKTEVNKKGEVPLVLMPLKQNRAMIVMGPAKHIDKAALRKLDALSNSIGSAISMVINRDELKKQVKTTLVTGKAIKNVSTLFTDSLGLIDTMMRISIRSIHAKGGLFINAVGDPLSPPTIIGLNDKTEGLIREDIKTLQLLKNLAKDKNLVKLTKNDKEFYSIPPYFIAEEIELLLLLNIDIGRGKGTAVFWYDENPSIKEYQLAALQLLSKRMGEMIDHQLKFKEIASSYIDMLRLLARMVDNLRPSTVGYSELSYRYAFIISREMKLSIQEAKDIALAAYLSNIGVIGLSDEILFKKGKYEELEYEMMKLHADAGASIIEATIGNQNLASYVRYHHERMDGYGYPEGLKGEEIPLGARIIAAIQVFLAKIIGREYREALPFYQAIDQLKGLSGTQLDREAVKALTGWLQRRQREYMGINRALGKCWEMRCSPETICGNCPAYNNTRSNCWDIPGNHCKEHGNNCETCFIRTEYLDRKRNQKWIS